MVLETAWGSCKTIKNKLEVLNTGTSVSESLLMFYGVSTVSSSLMSPWESLRSKNFFLMMFSLSFWKHPTPTISFDRCVIKKTDFWTPNKSLKLSCNSDSIKILYKKYKGLNLIVQRGDSHWQKYANDVHDSADLSFRYWTSSQGANCLLPSLPDRLWFRSCKNLVQLLC